MKTVILSALIASAAAFAPAKDATRASALASAFENELGAQAPIGFIDPLGLVEDGDQNKFDRLRYVELKHGRIAMLAVVGYLTTAAGVRFPGAEDIPCGFAALDAIPGMVWAQMIATWTMMEAANQSQGSSPWGTGNPDYTGFSPDFKGDFRNGFIDFGWDKQTDAWKTNKRTIELNQGRAAQMGILGLMVHEKLGNLETIVPALK